ncbi:prepilin-type N-terminal cleavage/methylation domain-containing protein [Haloferula sp. BvORR071]|uniref:prepilin-type N-terminal cleavage/methylation domain-containing protein n=1 Tax=Haloferula sp. BvORR071 TaxID=1396141 RepID=UPI00054E0548|nr:prepilin-type N-terminal cleavage/methylation domain-containing protein [Haloferula sp. BvORR071]
MIPSRKSHLTGFSLVELLVVILIISLLLTLGAGVMKSIGSGNSLGSAVATSEALFDEARAIAVGKGTRARVLVDVNDPQNEETYLRRLVLCYEELDEQGQPMKEKWVLSSRGQNLPEKTYFSKEFSKKNHETGEGDMEEKSYTFGKDIYDGKYIAYEFNSEGICTSPGTSFVIGSGVRPLGQAPRPAAEGKRDFGGFVVWRNGRTSLFRDPEQIGLPAQVTTF